MMYENVKLEKAMYHVAGRDLTELIEEQDPSAQYVGTPLEGLDAYERQLKRFNIHVGGVHCDRVEKFFSTTESAILFPEFIRRAIRLGLSDSILSDITAVNTRIPAGEYVPGILKETASYSKLTEAGENLPESDYIESSEVMHLSKYGRSIHATYEVIRRVRLDAFQTILRSIGVRLGNAILVDTVETLKNGTTLDYVTEAFKYEALCDLYGVLKDYNMTTVIASPENVAKILGFEQMEEMASTQPQQIVLPFGATLYKCAGMSDDYIVGIDRRFALEMITGGDVLLETDKLIDTQLDVITVSVRLASRVLTGSAVGVLAVE